MPYAGQMDASQRAFNGITLFPLCLYVCEFTNQLLSRGFFLTFVFLVYKFGLLNPNWLLFVYRFVHTELTIWHGGGDEAFEVYICS